MGSSRKTIRDAKSAQERRQKKTRRPEPDVRGTRGGTGKERGHDISCPYQSRKRRARRSSFPLRGRPRRLAVERREGGRRRPDPLPAKLGAGRMTICYSLVLLMARVEAGEERFLDCAGRCVRGIERGRKDVGLLRSE